MTISEVASQAADVTRVVAPAVSRYVDPVAVERAVSGDRVHLRPIERRAAVQLLTRQGLSARQIAERVGICSRSVQRHRSRPPVEVSTFG